MFDDMLVGKRENSPTTFAIKEVVLEECTVSYSAFFNDKTGDVDSYMDVLSFPGRRFLCGNFSLQSKWRELTSEST